MRFQDNFEECLPKLTPEEGKEFKQLVRNKYGGFEYKHPLEPSAVQAESLWGVNAWKLSIDFLVSQEDQILLFGLGNSLVGKHVFRVSAGIIINIVSLFGWKNSFFISNPTVDYLITYTDEQYLYTWGTAAQWLDDKKTAFMKFLGMPSTPLHNIYVEDFQLLQWGTHVKLSCKSIEGGKDRHFSVILRNCDNIKLHGYDARNTSSAEIKQAFLILADNPSIINRSFIYLITSTISCEVYFSEIVVELA